MVLPDELSDANGRKVVDSNGDEIGHVVDVLFDPYHIERAFLEIRSDHEGFLHRKERYYLAPLDMEAVKEDPISVPMVKKEIQEMHPEYNPAGALPDGYEEEIIGFWGVNYDPGPAGDARDLNRRRHGN